MLLSIGTGAAPHIGMRPGDSTSNIVSSLSGLRGNLMYQINVEQDIVCRTIGRCVFGTLLDREILDLMDRQGHGELKMEQQLAQPMVPLEKDLGKAFLYARYNADLSKTGLEDGLCRDGFEIGPADGCCGSHRGSPEDRPLRRPLGEARTFRNISLRLWQSVEFRSSLAQRTLR